jgi:predicted metal-dependent hydrolase
MADQCEEPLPDRVRHAITEFNTGQYFEQHETLEAVWRAEPRPIRELYRGILQIGLACYQVQRANGVGAIKMLDRAQRWLQPFRPACQGVEVDRLLADAERLRNEIGRVGFNRLDRIDRSLFPIVHLLASDHQSTNC